MKQRKFLLLLTMFFAINTSYSFSQQKFSYDELKVKNFSDMSKEQQFFFKQVLVKKLRNEPLVGEINRLQKKMVTEMMQAAGSRTQEQRNKLRESSKNLTPKEQLRLMGIENPENYMADQNSFKMKTLQLVTKYPELSKVDRVTLKQLFSDAEKQVLNNHQ
ncbi:hypothetical protein [Pedobacter sp. MC2016-24]|uniref:hypothetical protein n=1 Tax=Pedobacter sp. MC2016-24 TaxID=2780090 RepID=UPI00187EEE20|nr:hypothetical protein [Pedobacter sp. MC2016-24]MBE9601907.1 hypothetical protein [Pedobacter sp. MC2016-24]